MKEVTDKTVPCNDIQKQFEKEEAMQIRLLTETVSQLSFMVEYESMLISALLYNHLDMEVPNWKDHKEEFKKVEELCEKILEAHKKDGQRETDKS